MKQEMIMMDSEFNEKLKTGTTTVGIVCRDGVVLASESKATMGYMIAHKEVEKIVQIDDAIGVTTAGGVGDLQAVIRVIKAQIVLYKLERGPATLKAVTTLLSNIFHGNRYYPLMASMLVGGRDVQGYHLYHVLLDGSSLKDKYISTGSGSPFAYGVLEDQFNENMTVKEGIELAVKSIHAAIERDAASGGKHIRVATITEKGFEFVDEKIVKKMAG